VCVHRLSALGSTIMLKTAQSCASAALLTYVATFGVSLHATATYVQCNASSDQQ